MVYPGGLRKPNHNPHTESISCGLPLLAGLLPRIILTSDFGHASRARGGWPDPARVIRTHRAPGLLFPIEIGPDISAPLAAGLTGEQRLDVGQPDTIAPAIGADLDGMGALVVTAVNQKPARISSKVIFCWRVTSGMPPLKRGRRTSASR